MLGFVVSLLLALSLVGWLNQTAMAMERPSLLNMVLTLTTDWDTYPFSTSPSTSNDLKHSHITGTYSNSGVAYSAYLATFNPAYFSFQPPTSSGCTELVKPSVASSEAKCEYATNGAFFNFDMPASGTLCIGNLISDGKVWQLPTDGSGTKRVNFGLQSQTGKFVIGYMNTTEELVAMNFTNLITGWGWIVRDGKIYVDTAADLKGSTSFITVKAPRTALLIFADGQMGLLQVDGEEDINEGPDLYELASLAISLGAVSAANIDGGGSSVSVLNGQVIDQPTCNDTPEICERSDASFTCVRSS